MGKISDIGGDEKECKVLRISIRMKTSIRIRIRMRTGYSLAMSRLQCSMNSSISGSSTRKSLIITLVSLPNPRITNRC